MQLRPLALSYKVIGLALMLVLASCSGVAPQQSRPLPPVSDIAPTAVPITAPDLVARAKTVTPTEAVSLLLQAATMQRDQGDLVGAADTLKGIFAAALTPTFKAEVAVLQAELAMARSLPKEALSVLQVNGLPAPETLAPALQIRYHQVRATAQEANGAVLVSALERIALDHLLPSGDQRLNHDRIWQALATIPNTQLQTLAAAATDPEIRGWYDLAFVARSYSSDMDRQLLELQRWRSSWPTHPAATVLPPQMELLATLARERPRQVALLLPLGSNAGIVVRDAFMSAYFNLQELGGQVPLIKLYDTTTVDDIRPLHLQARQEGAQVIIGPLSKAHISQLQSGIELGVPTLALNNVEGQGISSPLLYQFALSPEDEARQLAERAWQQGLRYVAIIGPNEEGTNDVFFRKRQSFQQAWERLGGTVVALDHYRENYTDSISSMLLLNESSARAKHLEQLLGRPLITEQRRRQDIDFILLLGSPTAARQIVPSLAYLYAGDIPVYATQDIYAGIANPTNDRDLNGIIFGESPWLLGEVADLNRTRQYFPVNGAQALRLQAFGIDAFRLYPRLRLLESNAKAQIPGASGTLKLSDNHNIIRELKWATIRDGVIAPQD
jgi:uncharacterized protein